MEAAWYTELAKFLADLLAVQDESLELLTKKRDLLVAADTEGLRAVGKQEEQLIERLRGFVRRREQLLSRAAQQGLPSDSLRSLAAALPGETNKTLGHQARKAGGQARLLQHQSLTNWVLVQRTLIHLSQMLEIIATGGKMKPTYEKDKSIDARGALVDRAA